LWKGANFIAKNSSNLGLVVTNSISQGVQVPLIWKPIFNLGIKINYAYQGFKWENNAKGNAGIHVAVVGISSKNEKCRLFTQHNNQFLESNPESISPYLVSGSKTVVKERLLPLREGIKKMVRGSQPTDGGNFILNKEEKDNL
ncbi:DNA methyltransferase, partial [Haloferax sp. KTX1]|uniref:DNA methyltransferase n=1 Tax=Haloferax sp. KTX1 TaxID=2600597 RepID=UPI001C9E229E